MGALYRSCSLLQVPCIGFRAFFSSSYFFAITRSDLRAIGRGPAQAAAFAAALADPHAAPVSRAGTRAPSPRAARQKPSLLPSLASTILRLQLIDIDFALLISFDDRFMTFCVTIIHHRGPAHDGARVRPWNPLPWDRVRRFGDPRTTVVARARGHISCAFANRGRRGYVVNLDFQIFHHAATSRAQ